MRRVRYQVATSLDGFIAGPDDEFDWIVADPAIDFQAIFDQFDTLLVGRRTFEGMVAAGPAMPDMEIFVFSNTLAPGDYPDVTVVASDAARVVEDLRSKPGKDIWLFGGGLLFRSLLSLGLVDSVEVAVIPILLGGGIPLLPTPAPRASLTLTGRRVYEETGIVLLEYSVTALEPVDGES